MALLLLIIGLVIYFIFNVVPITKFHYVIAYLGLFIALASGIGIMANENSHFGMEEKTTTKVKSIKPTSALGQVNLLVYKQIGTKGPKVYVYNGKSKHTQVNSKTKNYIAKTTGKAELVTKETRFVFRNKFYQMLFGFLGEKNELQKRTNTFKLPKTWKVMSQKQVQTLKKKMLAQVALKKKLLAQKQAQAQAQTSKIK